MLGKGYACYYCCLPCMYSFYGTTIPTSWIEVFLHLFHRFYYACMYLSMCMNNLSRDAEKGKATTTTQQKGKATQHNSPETVIFQRKIGCLGWDSNPQPSALQAMLLPTELPRQLSWLGRCTSSTPFQLYMDCVTYNGKMAAKTYKKVPTTPP